MNERKCKEFCQESEFYLCFFYLKNKPPIKTFSGPKFLFVKRISINIMEKPG